MTYFRLFIVALTTLGFGHSAMADQQQYNQVSIQAMATQEVANDQLTATLTVLESGRNTAKLANEVNLKMSRIIDKSQHFPAIKTKTTSYTTQPIYKNGAIESWQVSQNIMLTSQDFDALAEFVGQLNELATVQSMTFSISQATIDNVKEVLTKQAIANFKQKAQMITQQFDKADYALIHVAIDANYYQPQAKVGRVMMMSADAESSAPALAAGTDNVSVSVNGTIELLAD